MKNNKYIYMNVVQVDYGLGFEDVCQSESWKEARGNFKDYCLNTSYPARMIKRRVLNESETS